MFGGIKIDKYDSIFSLYIRCRDNFTCTKCGNRYRPPRTLEKLNKRLFDLYDNPAFGDPMGLHCSHFWGRRSQSVRFDEANACAHCFHCHNFFSENPSDFVIWTNDRLGPDEYDKLQQRKNQIKQWKKGKIKGKKWDQRDEEVYEHFKKRIQEL